jgi:hypothetical protein
LVALFVRLSLQRLIDGDEGYLLVAARLVSEGQRIYGDFFCPQMPGMPLLYGAYFAIFGRDWESARILAALIAAGTGYLLFAHLRRSAGTAWALVGVGLFATTSLVFGWLPIAKTYGLATLFGVAGVYLFERSSPAGALSRAGLPLAGALFSMAMQTRLYLGVLLACGALTLWRRHGLSRTFARQLAGLAGGAAAALVVTLPSLVWDLDAFVFGTIRFHGMREIGQTVFVGDLDQKLQTLRILFSPGGTEGVAGLQFAILFVLALAARVSPHGPRSTLAGPCWVALFITSFLPTPTATQYFCVLVPFMVMDAITFLATLPSRKVVPAVAVLASVYLGLGVSDVKRYTRTGLDVPGIWVPDRASWWRLSTMRETARVIDLQGLDEAATWWPGYFVATRTALSRNLANDFGFRVAPRLSAEERAKYHVAGADDMAAMIREGHPRLWVQGNWGRRPVAENLPPSGFVHIATVENVAFWRWQPP